MFVVLVSTIVVVVVVDNDVVVAVLVDLAVLVVLVLAVVVAVGSPHRPGTATAVIEGCCHVGVNKSRLDDPNSANRTQVQEQESYLKSKNEPHSVTLLKSHFDL